MPLKIPVPDAAWSEVTVPLGGQTYDITYRFNERDPDHPFWVMDIFKESVPVLTGIKLVSNSPLIGYLGLDGFRHGELICQRMLSTTKEPGRDNVGSGKEYELVYYSAGEILAALES